MLPLVVEQALAKVEACFGAVSQALVEGEALELASASAALQQASVDYSNVFERLSAAERQTPALQERVKALTTGIGIRRESLARRAVVVERSLNSLVPATQSNTYAAGARPYGAPVKQTGAFSLLSA